ncbi:hypothetical protein DY000_02042743 [Brassica cretica]|uniref:Uncharacterized protein n=1 Tax=Brassica cretica TaxID=69181 RepID=A0ABQ7BEC6_BRACR|nr:hypothetical protein DY000_02042743 [Brassica cretica]
MEMYSSASKEALNTKGRISCGECKKLEDLRKLGVLKRQSWLFQRWRRPSLELQWKHIILITTLLPLVLKPDAAPDILTWFFAFPPATTVEEQFTVITISHEPVSATEPGSSSGSGSSAIPLDDLRREPAEFQRKSKKRPVFFCWSSVSIAVVKLPGSDDRILSGEEKRLSDFRHVDVP